MRRHPDDAATSPGKNRAEKGKAAGIPLLAAAVTAAGVAVLTGATGAARASAPGALPQAPGITGPIYSGITRKCLTYYPHSASGNPIAVLSRCTGGIIQQWQFLPDNTIRTARKCLQAVSDEAGSGVVIARCDKSPGQFWEIRAVVMVPGAQLLNPASGRCLADPGGSTVDGTAVQTRPCTSSAAQTWYPPTTPQPPHHGPSRHRTAQGRGG